MDVELIRRPFCNGFEQGMGFEWIWIDAELILYAFCKGFERPGILSGF